MRRRYSKRPGICTPETPNRSCAISSQPRELCTCPVLVSLVAPLWTHPESRARDGLLRRPPPARDLARCRYGFPRGAPSIAKLRRNETLSTELSAVTAGVVGVVVNLAVWLDLHVIVPDNGMVDWFAIVVSAISFFRMVQRKWDIVP